MDTCAPRPFPAHRHWRLFTLLLAMAAFLLSCTTPPVEVLRIGTNVWTGYEPLYLARELGYLDKSSVRLVEHASATNVIRDYRNGTIDAATLTLDEVLLLAQHKEQPRIVLIMDFSNGGDALVAQADIHSLTDLKGSRIGVENTAMGAYMMKRTLDTANIKPNDVHMVSLSVDQHERAFLKKEVDAVVTFEPVISKLLSAGAKELFTSAGIPGEIVDVLIVREEYLKKNPHVVDELIHAWFLTLDYQAREPEKSITIMAQRQGISPEQFRDTLHKLHIPDLQENLRQLGGTPPLLLHTANQLQDVMLEHKLLKNRIILEPLLYPRTLWAYERK